MEKNWYVISTYPGYEHRAKKMLERKIHVNKQEDYFGDILVPTEKVLELAHGVKSIVERRMFPGYLLAQIALTDDVWHLIRSVPKVRGLVGGPESPTVLSRSGSKRSSAEFMRRRSNPERKRLLPSAIGSK
jgi:transcriptional antiterminator NusG